VPAVGVLALVVAVWGSTSFEEPSPFVPPSDQRALLGQPDAGPVTSRSLDRQALEEQTQAQADQLLRAQEEVRASSQVQADALKAHQWVLPVTGYRVSGRYGTTNSLWSSGHGGLDLAGPSGSTIVSVAAGTVTFAGYAGSCGNMTQIQLDADDVVIKYCHQSRITVQPGQQVQAGEVVGYTGSTGRSTGPHLHVEVSSGTSGSGDPEAYLNEHNVYL